MDFIFCLRLFLSFVTSKKAEWILDKVGIAWGIAGTLLLIGCLCYSHLKRCCKWLRHKISKQSHDHISTEFHFTPDDVSDGIIMRPTSRPFHNYRRTTLSSDQHVGIYEHDEWENTGYVGELFSPPRTHFSHQKMPISTTV
ncbi:uncharacterized protein LOC134269601 isoform X1 [Saccostrea cucullata]|uniref:uncharacterized protein LOC134269601 isoform X1 n=1 Tax=Saccostrea cuccullata TaxID=36930 RepID=UPI002ED2E5ED